MLFLPARHHAVWPKSLALQDAVLDLLPEGGVLPGILLLAEATERGAAALDSALRRAGRLQRGPVGRLADDG